MGEVIPFPRRQDRAHELFISLATHIMCLPYAIEHEWMPDRAEGLLFTFPTEACEEADGWLRVDSRGVSAQLPRDVMDAVAAFIDAHPDLG
jgi:hypothetical protein